jgi:hypothetical protein
VRHAEVRFVERDGDYLAFTVFGEGPVDLAMTQTRVPIDLMWESGLQFEARGEHELKGVPGSWPILGSWPAGDFASAARVIELGAGLGIGFEETGRGGAVGVP